MAVTETLDPATSAVRVSLDAGEHAAGVNGDIATSRRHFERAHRLAEATGDGVALARAALGLAGPWLHSQPTASGRTLSQDRLRTALSMIEPDTPLAGRLRLRLIAETGYGRGDPAPVLAALRVAADTAGGELDPAVTVEGHHLALQCLLAPEQVELRHTLAAELLAGSVRTGNPGDLALGLLWQAVDKLLVADPTADRPLVELTGQLDRADHKAVRYVVQAIEVLRSIRAGRLDEAEALAQLCARTGAEAGDIDAEVFHQAHLITIRWYQGRLAELLPVVTDMPHSPALSPVDSSGFAALAMAQVLSGDHHRAASSLARLHGVDLAALPRSGSWLVTMYGIVEAACLLDDADTAASAYPLLAPHADLPMVVGLGMTCFGSTHHALGVAALTMGEVDRAVEHFRLAIRRNLAIGHWPAVIASRTRYAQALRRRATPADLDLAQRELDRAAHESAALALPVPESGPAPAPVRREPATLTRHGRMWRVGLGARAVTVPHSVGVAHLALLVANPGQEISALELVSGLDILADKAAVVSSQSMLDRVAITEYRNRLSVLEAEIAEFEADHDLERAATARVERDWLLGELTGATGIGGRTREFSDDRERARIAVGKAIRRAVGRIRDTDALIGEHLHLSVHTGLQCCYRPA